MKTNVRIQKVWRKWGHVLKWKKWKKMMKIERKWRKMKENEEKWKKMKDIIVSIRPRFQPIHWLPFSVAQFFTLSWVEHSSSNIYEYISYHFPSFEYLILVFIITRMSLWHWNYSEDLSLISSLRLGTD